MKCKEFSHYIRICLFALVIFASVVLGIASYEGKKLSDEPEMAASEVKLKMTEDISRLSQAIMGQFEGKPVRYLLDRSLNKVSFIVFDTEKADFDDLIGWFSENFTVQEAVEGVYLSGIQPETGLFCSVFWSGNDGDSVEGAELTYVEVANSRKISTENWPEIVVN